MVTNSQYEEFFQANNIKYQDIKINYTGKNVHITATKDLEEGDVVAFIPKDAVLSIRNTAIADILEEADLSGVLGLAVAIMYESSLGPASPWALYLSSIPKFEKLPNFWSLENQKLLQGTDVGRSLAEDVSYLTDDYNQLVLPFLDKNPQLDRSFMTLQHWFYATSLVTSRAFEVDEFHGESLIPLADLFNHRSGNEHVHIESGGSVCPLCGSGNGCACQLDEDSMDEDNIPELNEDEVPELNDDEIPELANDDVPELDANGNAMEEDGSVTDEDDDILEITVVKPCKAGEEVFNTYGDHSNASLLRLYGFIDKINPFSCVKIDREEILKHLKLDAEILEDRLLFWDSIGKDIVDQLGAMGDPEEVAEDHEHDHEGGCCGGEGDEDEGEYEDEEEYEEEGDCCEDEDCEGCDEGDENPLEDDFYIESKGQPSFALYAFTHLISMSTSLFETMAADLDASVSSLIAIKKSIEPHSKGLGPVTQTANALIQKAVRDRLTEYPSVESSQSSLSDEAVAAYALRDEEIRILNDYLTNF